ncbi:hypothetical protein JEY40_22260 [Bradyrhizobium japonicum]|uniref:hypothetical protein n=1 Tax=Bradyrhizobium japonicum TaxID=375 RepID=UPI00200EC8EA|nr:hypothetical protein [Bradyrhizobium japonicum]UQD77056.1 hypothetical protein JEY40_22260 [Bradyrhizobium japonicum]
MTIQQDIPCGEFTEICRNPSNAPITLQLTIDHKCGGDTVLGLYEIGTNKPEGNPTFHSGLNVVQVPANQYLVASCNGHDSDHCVASYDVA